jgi:hypothetical protein
LGLPSAGYEAALPFQHAAHVTVLCAERPPQRTTSAVVFREIKRCFVSLSTTIWHFQKPARLSKSTSPQTAGNGRYGQTLRTCSTRSDSCGLVLRGTRACPAPAGAHTGRCPSLPTPGAGHSMRRHAALKSGMGVTFLIAAECLVLRATT